MSKKSDAAAWEEAFKIIDVDQSGSIDNKELEGLLKQLEFDPSEIQEISKDIMVECDKNMDGKISWAEFEKAMKKASQQAQ